MSEEITYREALRRGLENALKEDSRTFLMGEDIGAYGGTYAVTKGFIDKFGPERIIDTPLSESGFVGAGIGAALNGMRPIIEIMTVNFSLLALDQIVNNAATLSHMTGGQVHVPIVIRMSTGAGRQLAAQHSHSWEGWYAHIPGLKILTPATSQDAYSMIHAALIDPDPVIIFEHAMLYNTKGPWHETEDDFDPFQSSIERKGHDITLIAYGGMLPKAKMAAEKLSKDGIEAEVIDLRCLRPLDLAPVFRSVKKNYRAVVIDEGWESGSLSAEIITRIHESCFYDLEAPVGRVCSKEVPIPYAKHMEEAAIPQIDDIVTRVKEVMSNDE